LQSDEQGRNFVAFGDGVRGARPSSGVNNVRATYRKGLGAAGNVAAESLTQPTQRPLGMKGVSNPLPAEGGTDPEDAELARQSMPLMTRTLGRAVSLLDYEDFARAFSGIAKARAQVLQLSFGPTIAITIAGSGGVVISPDSPIWINLAAALADNGDPHVAVRLLAHRPGTFRIGLWVKCNPDFESRLVLREVEAALRARFSFDARSLGQPVQQSELIAAAQGVRGVVAVDLDFLYGGTRPVSQTLRSLQVRLLANRMSVSDGVLIPDEVLTLHPGPFERLEEMP
jgi:predicted phage baseplate assembly protein